MKRTEGAALPTINVNLKPCDCGADPNVFSGKVTHLSTCASAIVLLPCIIPLRVTIMVRMGECNHSCLERRDWHEDDCPALPVRVVCNILGETWEASELADASAYPGRQETNPGELLRQARERWGSSNLFCLATP